MGMRWRPIVASPSANSGAQQICDAPYWRIAAHGIYRSITRRRASRHTVGGQQRRTTSLQRGVARERAAPICSTTSRVKKTATEGTLSKGQQDWGQDTALARRCQVKWPSPGCPPTVRRPDRYSRPMLHNVAAQAWERAVSGTGVAVLGGGGVAGWDADRVRLRVLGRQSWR